MKHDRPLVKRLRILAKMLVSFCIAVVFLVGFVLARDGRGWRVIIGWILITASAAVMVTTVRFWAAGFHGFVAYGALRSLGGVMLHSAFQVSALYTVSLSGSLFAMVILCHRFTSKKFQMTAIDRVTIVLAATCLLASVLFGDTWRTVEVFNLGNCALLVSWSVDRMSRHQRHRSAKTADPVVAG